jgi:hypothetical protein
MCWARPPVPLTSSHLLLYVLAPPSGTIEDLESAGVAPSSVDLVISNCVINLSPDKAACLQQVALVLVEGGEMYFSGRGRAVGPCGP